MNRFLQDCAAGGLCLGTLLSDRGTMSVTTLAKAGFSFVVPDLMYGSLDWSDVHYICSAARAEGISPLVRIQNYPWTDASGPSDQRLVADAARAMALGADGVRCSIRNADDIRAISVIANDWHRKPSLPTSLEELQLVEKKVREELVLMPIIESIPALDALEEIMAIDAVNSCMLSGTDLPRQMGIPFQYEHPDVWRFIDRAVELGEKHGVAVGFNTGYTFVGIDETVDRIGRLRDHGVKFIVVQTIDHLLFSYTRPLVAKARQRDAAASEAPSDDRRAAD